jgi:hypothetical protein
LAKLERWDSNCANDKGNLHSSSIKCSSSVSTNAAAAARACARMRLNRFSGCKRGIMAAVAAPMQAIPDTSTAPLCAAANISDAVASQPSAADATALFEIEETAGLAERREMVAIRDMRPGRWAGGRNGEARSVCRRRHSARVRALKSSGTCMRQACAADGETSKRGAGWNASSKAAISFWRELRDAREWGMVLQEGALRTCGRSSRRRGRNKPPTAKKQSSHAGASQAKQRYR